MSFDLESVAGRLAGSDLEDAGDLTPVDAARIRAAIAKIEKAHAGRRVRVVALHRGEAIEPWHALFDRARLDPSRDLLLLWNGRRLEGRGFALPASRIHETIQRQALRIDAQPGEAIVAALDELAVAALGDARAAPPPQVEVPRSAPPQSAPEAGASSLALLGGGGLAALAVLGGLGWVIRRRAKRTAESKGELNAALESAEQRYAELMLAAEELDAGSGRDLQLRAGTLKQRLDAVAAEARRSSGAAADPVTAGKVRQLENEIAALRSTVLQKRLT